MDFSNRYIRKIDSFSCSSGSIAPRSSVEGYGALLRARLAAFSTPLSADRAALRSADSRSALTPRRRLALQYRAGLKALLLQELLAA